MKHFVCLAVLLCLAYGAQSIIVEKPKIRSPSKPKFRGSKVKLQAKPKQWHTLPIERLLGAMNTGSGHRHLSFSSMKLSTHQFSFRRLMENVTAGGNATQSCLPGYNWCPPTSSNGYRAGCDINGGCEMDDCCAGNGCSYHAGEPPEYGYNHTKGCSYECNDCGPNGTKDHNETGDHDKKRDPWECMYITGEMVGLPAPFNGLISSSDGSTKYIEKGISATSDFIGSDFCPCHDIPGGYKVPVDGVWEHYMNVTAGSVVPHEGTFCRSPPEWVDFTKNNMCEDPKDFNPGAMEGICATVMRMCHAVAPYGGFDKSMMYMIAGITAPCCNNNTAYNNHSGCGAMKEEYIYRPVDYDKYEKVDYCDGGELNVNATAFFECKSPEDSRPYNWDDEVEQCHTNECKSSAFACIAARGKAIPHNPSKNYSMHLEPTGRKCGDVYMNYCRELDTTHEDMGSHIACYSTSSEGHFERCVDAECHKSKEACMSRAGTMTHDGRRYGTMVWRPQPDVQDVSHKTHMVNTMNRFSSKCCNGGGYKDACLSQKVKNAVYEYHTCANPWTYNVSKDHCSEDWTQSCRHQMEGRGVCYNPDQIWEECHDEWWEDGSVKGCKYSQEDCSTRRPGFKFRPYFHAEKALNIGFEYTRTAHRCCEDQKVSEGCKNGDSYLQEPPTIDSFQICHDMSKFRPTVILEEDDEKGQYRCKDAIPNLLHGHLFYKGECSPHPDGCRVCSASKTACEYFGGTFTPLTQSKLETDSYYQRQELSECCGGIDNVKNPYTLTQYVKDGFVDTIPAPGVCVRDSCCGEGTVWEDGYGCIPTKSGMVDACKAARGKWGWTCEAETGCSA